MGIYAGIDLGTTNSAVAYVNAQNIPVVLKNEINDTTTPSAIYFKKDGSIKIGKSAKSMEQFGETAIASFYKRDMGNANLFCNYCGKNYNAIQCSAVFLKELVRQVEIKNNLKIDKAVITVPAYFTDIEKQNTRKAAEEADIQVIKLINEPTAAAIAYGFGHSGKEKTILVYDLGGGTFDVTLAHIKEDNIDVIATDGDHKLGGKDWDRRISDWLLEQFDHEHNTNYRNSPEIIKRVMVTAEKAKKDLSEFKSTEIYIELEKQKGVYKLTEDEFCSMTEDLLSITHITISELLNRAGKSWSDIDDVILVGGSTRMNMVSDYIKSMLGKEPLRSINPDEAVAVGAAIQADTELKREKILPPGNQKTKMFIPQGEREHIYIPGEIKVSDVISHSLGMVSVSEDGEKFVNDIMIPRNTPFSKAYTTKQRELKVSEKAENNELDIYLLQGDSPEPIGCTVIKKYTFRNIEYVDGGITKLNITYFHTDSGTVDVEAVQLETGRKLIYTEEPIEEDLNWLTKSPQEVYGKNIPEGIVSIYIALDFSGSMSGKPIREAVKAIKTFAGQFDMNIVKLGIVGFATKVKEFMALTNDSYIIDKEISLIENRFDAKIIGGGTSAQPLTLIREKLQECDGAIYRYALVLTDGQWYGSAVKESYEEKKRYIDNELDIVALGFGTADEKFLKQISTKTELAKFDDLSNLTGSLCRIAQVINDDITYFVK